MTFPVEYADCCRIVRSLALPFARASIMSGDLLQPRELPDERRRVTAGAVARFFGLDNEEVSALTKLETYEQWAGYIFRGPAGLGLTNLAFSTSGSTGPPMFHSFTAQELEEEAQSLEPFFAGAGRVVSVMPVHHIFGFAFAVMLPRILGIEVLDRHPLPSDDFFKALQPGDLILAFPVFWKSVLDMSSGPRPPVLPPEIHGVSSGAPCPPEVIEGLLAAGPVGGRQLCAGMTEIYGATEFGAVGLRRECRGDYALLPHWRRVALPGQEDVEEWGIQRKHGGPQPLPDRLDWRDERNFRPLRRKDKAVQVAGINVFPEQVAEILRGHPMVADCAVRLMRPEEGARLKAFVVPQHDLVAVTLLMRELRRMIADRLEPAARPKSIRFGKRLPRTASGKAADWDINDGNAVSV
ncbi:MAG: AMP-binding protein [Desulfovibrio sp.]|jgi:4-coumarate--CoA ligase (photoactive yellow protein activation family)|nr:AMP-binding protein [Desulfovibrio sp.]